MMPAIRLRDWAVLTSTRRNSPLRAGAGRWCFGERDCSVTRAAGLGGVLGRGGLSRMEPGSGVLRPDCLSGSR